MVEKGLNTEILERIAKEIMQAETQEQVDAFVYVVAYSMLMI